MNILILSWRGPGHPNAGGAEISTHEHAKRWVKAGHEVTLFTTYYKGAKQEEAIDGVKVIRQGRQFIDIQWRAFYWYLFQDHPDFDLVIDQFHGIPFFTPLYIRKKKLAFIHEVTKEVWQSNPWSWPFCLLPKIFGPIIEPLIFKLFYKSITFLTVSESTKSDLMDWGIPRQNINVIHNGINIPSMFYPKKKEIKTITFLGALAKDKGIEDAIRVFSILQKKRITNLQYWIIGKTDDKYLNSLKKLIINLGLTNIKFWGFVSEKKKFELLAESYLLINPSIREGWGLVVIEAARVGTPAIAFNVPGLRDSILDNKTGILCQDRSTEALSEAVLEVLEDDRKYEYLRDNAVLWSKNFSWDKAGAESLKLIKNIYEK